MTNVLMARYKKEFIERQQTLGSDKETSLSDNPAVVAHHRLAMSMIYRYFPDHLLDALDQDIATAINRKFFIETDDIETAKDWISSNTGGLR